MSPRAHRAPASVVPAWRPRTYSPIKLDDQGPSYRVPSSLFPIAGRDQSWNSRADNFLQANLTCSLTTILDDKSKAVPFPLKVRPYL